MEAAEVSQTSTCIVCGQAKEAGIMVIQEFICESCEAEMVQTDVEDSKYPFFIQQLKRIWFKSDVCP